MNFFLQRERERKKGILLSRKLNISNSKIDWIFIILLE